MIDRPTLFPGTFLMPMQAELEYSAKLIQVVQASSQWITLQEGNQASGAVTSLQLEVQLYQPALLQQHITPTMDDDPTSFDPISALLRAGDIFNSQWRSPTLQ